MTTSTAYVAKYESDADYHADRSRLSGSALELFLSDPSRYAAWMRGEFEQDETPAMAFGSLFHCLLLEPEALHERFAVEPEDPENPGKCIRRSRNDYKSWAAEVREAGRSIVTPEYMAQVGPMADAIRALPRVFALLTGEGDNEVALHWGYAGKGRPMRAKLDRILWDRDIIVELKTDKDPNPEVTRHVWGWHDRGYHRKAHLYLDAYYQVTGRNATMVHIFVQNVGDRPRVLYTETQVDSPAAQWGEIEVESALRRLRACETAKDFRFPWEPDAPGYQPRSLPLPEPILRQLEFAQQGPVELTIGGEDVTV